MAVDYLQQIGGNVSQVGNKQIDSTYGSSISSGTSGQAASPGSSAASGAMMGLKITGAFLNAYSAYSSMASQEYASKYNKALISSERAIATTSYDLERNRIKKIGDRTLSSQRAVLASSGFEFSGTAVDIMSNTVEDIEMDLFALRFNQMVSESNYQTAWDKEDIAQKKASAMKIPAAINSFIGGFI